MKYKIPQNDKELLLEPKNKEEILNLCKLNREKREEFKKFFEFETEKNFVVASGHQIIFYHPGIWAKNIFLNLVSKTQLKTVFYEHDVDGIEGLYFYYPDKKLKIKREYIFYNPDKIALEYIESKHIIENKKLIDKVIDRLPDFKIKKNALKFFEIFKDSLKKNAFYSEAFVSARKEYEENPGYKSVFLSDVFNSPLFFKFFAYFFAKAEEVLECYNNAILEYRKKYKIKNKTEPAPLLEKENNLIELPFFLNLRERYKVYKKDNKLVCSKFEIELGKGEEIFYNSLTLPLRPRSLILSLYQKIFLCDLFYHGVSGKNYDETSNIFCRKFFGIEPPETGVISLTLFIKEIKKRDFPFFFFEKEEIEKIISFSM